MYVKQFVYALHPWSFHILYERYLKYRKLKLICIFSKIRYNMWRLRKIIPNVWLFELQKELHVVDMIGKPLFSKQLTYSITKPKHSHQINQLHFLC